MGNEGTIIGGDSSAVRFIALFVGGVLVGTVLRSVAWILPTGAVDTVKQRLP
jgi:hypothetical protein